MIEPGSVPFGAVLLADVARDEVVEAPAGTLVFVRDPGLIRSATATADGTAILAIGSSGSALRDLPPGARMGPLKS